MSSNLPLGAEYDPNAPWNEVEPDMETCNECGGCGKRFFDEDGNEVTECEYALFPDKYEVEVCDYCDGTGEVETEPYEPDPDEEYDSRYD